MKSLKDLCLASADAPNFGPERLHQLEAALVEDHRNDLPWYLRAIMAIGAWVASLFFLGFVITIIGPNKVNTGIGIVGIILLVVAVAVGRQSWGLFAGQCALAVSLAAQAMIYIGFLNEHQHPLGDATIYSIVLAGVLYVAYPAFLSRLLTCFASFQITLFWLKGEWMDDLSGQTGGMFSAVLLLLFWGLHLGLIVGCFLRPRHAILLAPLGYATVASLVAWQMENLCQVWWHFSGTFSSDLRLQSLCAYLRVGLTASTLLLVAVWAAGGLPALKKRKQLFLGLVLALATLVALYSGAVLLALLLILLGFSLQNRAILGLGLLTLPVFLTFYYYNLRLDLLMKSGVLVGSGVVVLLVRTGLSRGLFAEEAP